MAEIYCGKDCAGCAYKEEMNCPGCLAGPGRPGGDCTLAQCCRKKGHQACVTCSYNLNCGVYKDKHRMPEYRRKRIEAERAQQESIAKRAPFLGKWLWLLFWLFIPSGVFSVMTNENLSAYLPSLQLPGLVLNILCNVVFGVILLRLSTQEDHYRSAGICVLINVAVSILLQFISLGEDLLGLAVMLALPTIIVGLVGEYHQFMAHATVLTGVDNRLSDNWTKLWKWNIGMYGAVVGGLLVMLFVPGLGVLLGAWVIIGAAIGIVVVSILKLVFLYRTARAFRHFKVKVMQ